MKETASKNTKIEGHLRKLRDLQTLIAIVFMLLVNLILVEAKQDNVHANILTKEGLEKLQQKRIVKGKVTSEDNDLPIIGVTVVVKGTTNGTITNHDGYYEISVEEGDILVFSYVGMLTKEILISDQTIIDVRLSISSFDIDEVVAIGYGTQKKSDVTGSVSSFDTDALRERPQTNVLQSLQGNMAGISVVTGSSSAEGNAAILVRGQNSITASNAPLIVLDGIPYDGGFSQINPNDIERIEVLKDASSTAIYGSRGANGVILITSKKGEKGKLRVSYNTYYSWDEVAHLPDMQNASDFWRDQWERNITNPLSLPGNTTDLVDQINSAFNGDEYNNTEINAFMQGFPDQTWLDYRDNILSNYPADVHDRESLLQLAKDFTYPEGGRNTDWVDLASRTGHKQQHDLSISGGTEKMTFYLSGIHDKSEGIAKGDDFERTMFRFNFNVDLLQGITYGTNTSLGYYDRSGIPADWGMTNTGAFWMSPLYIPYNENGTININPVAEESRVDNPLEPLLFQNEDQETRLITNHYLNIKIPWVKGLEYKLNTGYRWNARQNKTYKGVNTKEGLVDKGNLSIIDQTGKAWTIENIVSYIKDFGPHSIFLTGLYSAQENENENNSMNGKGFNSDLLTYYQPSAAEVLTGDASYRKKSYISQMFRAHYGFDKRYLITATIRRDGYSAFGDDTKFGLFPSLALGWNMANEGFMQSIEVIDVLKLRLSYGESGNEAISPYSTLPILSSNKNYIDYNGNVLYGYYPKKLSNPLLGWESTSSFNLGLDFTLYSGRVRGTIDAYSSKTTDLLLNETISPVNGTTEIIRNIGETENKGLEFQIASINVHSGDFLWETNFNWTINESKIVHVGLTDEDGNYIDDLASEWFIGYPVGVNFDYELDRILQKEDFILDDNGEYILDDNDNYQLLPEISEEINLTTSYAQPGQPILKDNDGDGSIGGAGDKKIHGDRMPDFSAGMTNTFKYKNLKLIVFVNGVWGVNKQNNFNNNRALGPKRKLNLEYWTPEVPTNFLPGVNASGMYPGFNYYPYVDVNYLRIQDITLSYQFPKQLINRVAISEVEVFTNIKNLYTYTNWVGLDPEYISGDLDGYVDVPRARSYIFGVRVTF